MLKIDKHMLVDNFEYQKKIGINQKGKEEFGESQQIEYARIDRSGAYTRTKTELVKTADAVIFCYAEHTTPFLKFKEGDRVVYDGTEKTIDKVVVITELHSNRVWAYELEVS